MSRLPVRFLVLASVVTCAACAPKGGGGGGANIGGALKPGTIQLSPRMTQGKGNVVVTPQGTQVRLSLHAESLPAPSTYSLWLTGHGSRSGDLLAHLTAKNGRIDYVATYPAGRFTGWTSVELMHEPSGKPFNFSLIHPALVGALPRAERTR